MRKMRLHRRPFAIDDAVYAGIAQRPVCGDLMLPQYAVQFRAQPLDAGAALPIEEMGAKLHRNKKQLLEGMGQEQ